MRRITPSMIVALIALVVALSGTAIAANGLISGAQIKNHSISASKMTYPAIAILHGARGPRGHAGRAGANGGFDLSKVTYVISAPQSVGPDSFALVNANCPAGAKAIGGGGGVSGGRMGGSAATNNGKTWQLAVANDQSFTINEVYAFAVCAAP